MKIFFRGLIVCLSLLLLWQAIVSYWQLPDYILPAPWRVLIMLGEQRDLLASHTIPTLLETIVGFLLGILFGCSAAILIVFCRPLGYWFLPILIISQAIPVFAIAPIFVIWLGYGLASKIAISVLMIFFPVSSALYDGLRRTQTGWLDLAKTMNASRWRQFMVIRLPAALPDLASGIRISAVAAPMGAIVGEWVGSSRGLGYLMLNANARMQIDMMFAALIIIIIMALLFYFCIDKLLRLLVWWQS
jgi:putative hydroxymethylpyrimidine transport system permease protein